MKNLLTLLFVAAFGCVNAQNVLFVNDNDNNTDNRDSMLVALQSSGYSFDVYSIPDSSGTVPNIGILELYDLVIWYTSSDGVSLGLWSDGDTGETNLTSYLYSGGAVWLIGTDILYAGFYPVPSTFIAGSFAYDYMGLESYNAQSYGDDGGVGMPQADLIGGAPASFPDSITWSFPTFWWADAVTPRAGSIDIYEMGPNSYSLAGEITMTHFFTSTTNMLSTFFDPVLISTPTKRDEFVEISIDYMLNFLSVKENTQENIAVYPNPVTTELNVDLEEPSSYEIYSFDGKLQSTGELSLNETIDVSRLEDGMYILQLGEYSARFVKK